MNIKVEQARYIIPIEVILVDGLFNSTEINVSIPELIIKNICKSFFNLCHLRLGPLFFLKTRVQNEAKIKLMAIEPSQHNGYYQ